MKQSSPPKSLHWVGVLMVIVAAAGFSTKAIVAKLMYRSYAVEAIDIIALRMTFALPFFIGFAVRASRKAKTILSYQEHLQIIALGLLGYYISSFLDFKGLRYISASLERLILFLYPTFVTLIAAWRTKKQPSRRQTIALLISYIGILIVFAGDHEVKALKPDIILGITFIFGCAITYAIYLIGNGEIASRVGVNRFTSYAMVAACAGSIFHYLISRHSVPAHLDGGLIGYGLLLALVCTVGPTFLISEGIRRIGAPRTAMISSIGPVFTIGLSTVFLGEHLTYIAWGGAALVLFGVWLVSNDF